MIPLIGTSQDISILTNKKDIYLGLVQGDWCRKYDLPKAIKIAETLDNLIVDQHDSIVKFAEETKKLNATIEALEALKLKANNELEALKSKKVSWYNNKWYYLGAGLFTGAYLIQNNAR